MPEGGKLDRCHQHVMESLENKGTPHEKADGLAWGICNKRIKEDTDGHISDMHSGMDQIEKEINNLNK